MSQASYSIIESAFLEDIITSGDYESAENLLLSLIELILIFLISFDLLKFFKSLYFKFLF